MIKKEEDKILYNFFVKNERKFQKIFILCFLERLREYWIN